MTPIQLLGVVFAIAMIYLTYVYYKKKIFIYYDALIWIYVWVALLFAVLFPYRLDVIIQPLKIIRVMDLFTIGAVFLLFAIVFVVFAKSRYSERMIEAIVKELALAKREWEKEEK